MASKKKAASQEKIAAKLSRLKYIIENSLSKKEFWPVNKVQFSAWEDINLNLEKISRPTLDAVHNRELWMECNAAIQTLLNLSKRRTQRALKTERIQSERDQLKLDVSEFAGQMHAYLFRIRSLEEQLSTATNQRDDYRDLYFKSKEKLSKVVELKK